MAKRAHLRWSWRIVLAIGAAAVALPAAANPRGGQVVGGAATIQGQGTPGVVINQTTPSGIINWQSFNIGVGESTRFNQPSASSVTLNRVTGEKSPSSIFGSLSANGRIFLVNPEGFIFGPTASINTASFLATTHDIKNEDFLAGRFNFTIAGNPKASIVNQGRITVTDAGIAALVAPGVRNDGVITARLGRVALASANAFTLDLYGDNLIKFALNDQIAAEVIDVTTGKPIKSLVENRGTLNADGGVVALTAVTARNLVDSVINNTGVIEARSVGTQNGQIVLGAQTEKSKVANTPRQHVAVSGRLDASGKAKAETGGKVKVTGEVITVAAAAIDVSGDRGGGTVLIGGDVGGGIANSAVAGHSKAAVETTAVPTATTANVDAATSIEASATGSGNGGKVVIWADQAATFDGRVVARGGSLAGDGGFVETSGKESLSIQTGHVDTSAPQGRIGDWLLDPASIFIATGGTASLVNVAAFGNFPGTTQTIAPGTIASAASNVTLQATLDIQFFSPISMLNNGVGITAQAGRNIVVHPGATISTRGGDLTFTANQSSGPVSGFGVIAINDSLRTNGGGLTGGDVNLLVAGGTGTVLFNTTQNASVITTAGGQITIGGRPIGLHSTDNFTTSSLALDTTGGGLASGSSINFTNAVNGTNFGRQLLTLRSGSSDIFFGGNVSVGGMTIVSARDVIARGFITANRFFNDTAQTGNLSIPGGISTRGVEGTTVPGNENAGPINIVAAGNVTVGTDANSFLLARGGHVAASGVGGNGADITVRAGGTLTLAGISSRGGIPKGGSTDGGDAGNISLTGSTISLLGYPPSTFSGVPNLTLFAVNATGGPNHDTTAFFSGETAGKGGNITLNGTVVLRGGPGTSVHIANLSSGRNTDIIINGRIDATTPGAESLSLRDGHGQISTGNIGANVRLNSVRIQDNVSGSFGSVSANSLTRFFSTALGDFGHTTTAFSGPVDISGTASLRGTNLIFADRLSVGGAVTFGSANLTARSVSVGGPTTISSDTTINTSQSNGAITMAKIDGTTAFSQSLTLNAGQGQVATGNVGASVPLSRFTVIGGTASLGSVNAVSVTRQVGADATTQQLRATNETVSGASNVAPNNLSLPSGTFANQLKSLLEGLPGLDSIPYALVEQIEATLLESFIKTGLFQVTASGYLQEVFLQNLRATIAAKSVIGIGADVVGDLIAQAASDAVKATFNEYGYPNEIAYPAAFAVSLGIKITVSGGMAALQAAPIGGPAGALLAANIAITVTVVQESLNQVVLVALEAKGLVTDKLSHLQSARDHFAILNINVDKLLYQAQQARLLGDTATSARLAKLGQQLIEEMNNLRAAYTYVGVPLLEVFR